MSYTITTVADILSQVNKGLFIPGIQRPYVWTQDQVIRLFDSLMRKYPIGTLLLWDLPLSSRQDWEIYKFVENFWQGDLHNEQAKLPNDAPCTLVLDGQQRLTSLLVGLKGTYTVRKKGKRRSNADAWEELALHIDLAHAPEGDDAVDDDDSPLTEHYRFAFIDVEERPRNKPGEVWFELAFIFDVQNEGALQTTQTNWIENNTNLSEGQKAVARANLRRLWEMVWQDQAIAHFTEYSTSYDRVLDIFIRANDGGTRLSRSDLLMSVITLRWEQFNAREETELLLSELTELLEPKRAIQREYLLRCALFFNNLDFAIQVKNFTPSNIRKLEGSWEDVKQSLLFTARWMRSVGLYSESLTGMNVVMMVAYFFKSTGITSGSCNLTVQTAERVRQWVITIQFQRLLSLQVKSTLSEFRNIVRRLAPNDTAFPITEVGRIFARNGRHFGFDEDDVNRFCSAELGTVQSEKLLSLLYNEDLSANRLHPLPLVQHRYFMPEELRRAGLPDSIQPSLQQHANKLGLAVALTEREAADYHALPLEQWLQTLNPQQLQRHQLPPEASQYTLADLPELIRKRKQLITQHLKANLPETQVS